MTGAGPSDGLAQAHLWTAIPLHGSQAAHGGEVIDYDFGLKVPWA